MKGKTMGFGEGKEKNIFNKDKRGRTRPRGSQRAAPATGPHAKYHYQGQLRKGSKPDAH